MRLPVGHCLHSLPLTKFKRFAEDNLDFEKIESIVGKPENVWLSAFSSPAMVLIPCNVFKSYFVTGSLKLENDGHRVGIITHCRGQLFLICPYHRFTSADNRRNMDQLMGFLFQKRKHCRKKGNTVTSSFFFTFDAFGTHLSQAFENTGMAGKGITID